MKRIATLFAAFTLFGIGAFAVDSSCVKCHTSDATMKELFVPPTLAASEGEG